MRYKAGAAKPWLGKDGELIWSQGRVWVAQLIWSQTFETFMGIVILFNIVPLDTEASTQSRPKVDDHRD